MVTLTSIHASPLYKSPRGPRKIPLRFPSFLPPLDGLRLPTHMSLPSSWRACRPEGYAPAPPRGPSPATACQIAGTISRLRRSAVGAGVRAEDKKGTDGARQPTRTLSQTGHAESVQAFATGQEHTLWPYFWLFTAPFPLPCGSPPSRNIMRPISSHLIPPHPSICEHLGDRSPLNPPLP